MKVDPCEELVRRAEQVIRNDVARLAGPEQDTSDLGAIVFDRATPHIREALVGAGLPAPEGSGIIVAPLASVVAFARALGGDVAPFESPVEPGLLSVLAISVAAQESMGGFIEIYKPGAWQNPGGLPEAVDTEGSTPDALQWRRDLEAVARAGSSRDPYHRAAGAAESTDYVLRRSPSGPCALRGAVGDETRLGAHVLVHYGAHDRERVRLFLPYSPITQTRLFNAAAALERAAAEFPVTSKGGRA